MGYFLWIKHAVDGWHFEYPKWWDLFKQAHQHLADLACHGKMISVCQTLWVSAPWSSLIFAYSDHRLAAVFFFCALAFWRWATLQTPWHLEIWFEHSGQAFRLDWGPGCEDNIADIHRDLKVCERQTMEHLFAWGQWSFLPAQRFWSEYKASFPLFLRNVLF